jgi:predicted dehydrogenase
MRVNSSQNQVSGSAIRVGLLGAGAIAPLHAQILPTIPGVRLVGVADVDYAKAQLVAGSAKTAAFSSLDEMLREAQPDAVHILLPPERHAIWALKCLAANKHVFVEKPLCTTESECRELDAAAKQHRRLVGVNHNITFSSAFLRLVEIIRQRRLGELQHVSVFWSVPFGVGTYGTPLYQREGPGAVILETGPHPLSLVVRLLGPVRSASALTSRETQAFPDTWQVSLNCERGTAQCFIAIGRPRLEMRIHAIGEDGTATADLGLGHVAVSENTSYSAVFYRSGELFGLARSFARASWSDFVTRLRRIPSGGAANDAFVIMRSSVAAFYEALRSGNEPKASLAEGTAVVAACRQIIAAGQSLPSKEEPWLAKAS